MHFARIIENNSEQLQISEPRHRSGEVRASASEERNSSSRRQQPGKQGPHHHYVSHGQPSHELRCVKLWRASGL